MCLIFWCREGKDVRDCTSEPEERIISQRRIIKSSCDAIIQPPNVERKNSDDACIQRPGSEIPLGVRKFLRRGASKTLGIDG